jgi:hypothetical protein
MSDHAVVELLFEIVGPIAVLWVVGWVCWVGEAWEHRQWTRRIEAQIAAGTRRDATGT